jgi:serine/threonine protein kinase
MDDNREALNETETKEKADKAASATVRVDEQDSIIGTLLDGRYLVKRKLGQGGFGVVYLASDEKMMSRPVVVKCMHDAEIANEWSVRKFKQEMEALARIDHPSIVGVFDTGQLPDGKPYIVMQYVDGCSLRTLITPEGMDFWRAANIIRQIGRALTTAHDLGILHRDLKPENIMVQKLGDGEEQVKIIDFGIAKVKNSTVSSTSAGDRTVGTIAYMSPEQLSAGPVSPASDVYCFAVIAYEMLTGRRPANPESAYQLLEMQRSGVRVKPIDLRPGIPELAQAIILKGLSFEPKARHQRARDFADLLASVLIGDDEQTVLQTSNDQTPTARDAEITVQVPEMAHVLFTDIVAYAKKMIDEQPACIQKLQAIVSGTADFGRAQRTQELIRLPTGDGIALVFFGDPEAPARCALEISRAMKDCPEFQLRMGIHSGLVYRTSDINTNLNVSGGGINIAQRVMDCGDAGHILVSKRVADDLGQMARWSTQLHDIGEAEVKHGVRVHLFNLYTDEFGNSETPAKLRPAPSRFPPKRTIPIAAALIVAVVLGIVALFVLKPRLTGVSSVTSPVVAPPLREQSLTYWLTVQKMSDKKPVGDPFDSAGDVIFGNGWRFRFNFQPAQNGALYLLNEGPGADNKTEYNVLFPNPKDNGGLAELAANQLLNGGWNVFVDQTGVEKLWLIWAAQVPADLDAVFHDAANHGGVIGDVGHIETVQNYLKQYDKQRLEVNADKAQKRTTVKAKGDVVVSLVELSHEKY